MTEEAVDLGLPRRRVTSYLWKKRMYSNYFIDLMGEIIGSMLSKTDAQGHYFGWPDYLFETKVFPTYLNYDCANILIFTQDFISGDLEQQYYEFFKSNIFHKFILFTGSHNFNIDLPNVRVVHWGGDILMQEREYKTVEPVRVKEFSHNNWVSLSNSARPARILAATLLLGLGLKGRLRIGWAKHDEWRKEADIPEQYAAIVDSGLALLKENANILKSNPPYANREHNNNAENFDQELRVWYKNSAVEIVNETLFFNQGGLITEKFRNSVWGFNLPIVMSTPGTVAHLRELGFDMFDDIIDHSYDLMEDHYERAYCAITDNIQLLNDPAYSEAMWHKAYPRLEANYLFARDKMGSVYKDRTIKQFKAIYPEFFVFDEESLIIRG